MESVIRNPRFCQDCIKNVNEPTLINGCEIQDQALSLLITVTKQRPGQPRVSITETQPKQ